MILGFVAVAVILNSRINTQRIFSLESKAEVIAEEFHEQQSV